MNTDYESYETAARRGRDHAHLLVHNGTALSQHEPHGSVAGVVCVLCWDFARDLCDLHTRHVPHHVPGVPGGFVGCCPDHDIRPRHTLRLTRESTTDAPPVVADGGSLD